MANQGTKDLAVRMEGTSDFVSDPQLPARKKPATMKNGLLAYIFLAALSCASLGANAENASPDTTPEAAGPPDAPESGIPDFKGETLTGDWNGSRSALYLKGVDIGLTLKNDIFANTHGGIKTGGGDMAHAEARLTLDLEKLFGWESSTAFFLYHSNLGGQINQDYVGAFMGVDNIEVGANTAQFFDAWIQKSFFDDHLSVLLGLYHVDSEFYVTESSCMFLQPPYGMANEMAQSGVNGPPIFPLGALAMRIKFTTGDKRFYWMAAVTDGVPGDPDDPRGTHIKLAKGDASLAMVEFGYTPHDDAPSGEPPKNGGYNKTAVGLWRYSAKLADLGGPDRHKSQGAYLLAERSLLPEAADPSQGLAGFVRYGVASDKVNVLDWSGSVGLIYQGLIPERDDDIAGIAITVNHAGKPFRASGTFDTQEVDLEASYRMQVKPWLAVQPTLQYVVNPGFAQALSNALVAGVRFEIEF